MKTTIKALSLRQPFATLIATGLKKIETRKWQTPYRGPLLICASAGKPMTGTGLDLGDKVPRGQALCIVDLDDCRPMTTRDELFACCPVYPRAQSWILSNLRPIEPFAVKGCLYLFDVEIDDALLKGKP